MTLWRPATSRRWKKGRAPHPCRKEILDDIEKGIPTKIIMYKYGISRYMHEYFKKTYFVSVLVRKPQLELDL